ncbi:MAG TPA: S8 family serine peptidase [Phytomonospora sp.]
MTAGVRPGAVAGGAVALGLVLAVAAAGPASAEIGGWQLEAVKAPEAQEVTTGEGVVVAVLDTGVGEHPDLDGKVLDGKSFVDGDPRRDQDGHGTDMAAQVLSVAPDAKILPVQVTSGGDGFSFGAAVEGIRWAVDNGAQVINISLAGSAATDDAINAISYALDHEVPVIAGTGNDPSAEVGSPAYLPGVVAVSGFDESGEVWDEATTGPETDLSAPAANIQGVIPDGPGTDAGYRDGGSGTSIATALTSGVAALVRAKFPDASAADVVNRLITTAEDAGAPGRDDQFGYGKVDAYAAVTADVPPVEANPLGDPAEELSGTEAASDASEGGLTPAMLLAAVGGGVVLLAVVVIVAVMLGRRKKNRTPPPGPYTYPPPPPPPAR